MHFLLPIALAALLMACANQGSPNANFNQANGSAMLSQGDPSAAYGGMQAARPRQSLTTCVYAKNAMSRSAPTLASHILRKAPQSGGQIEVGLEDVLHYTQTVLNASGGDAIAAAELISTHEAADTACFRDQMAFWKSHANGGPDETAKTARYLGQANASLGQVYSTLKTHAASGDVGDLAERLSRSYIPVGMRLPGTIL